MLYQLRISLLNRIEKLLRFLPSRRKRVVSLVLVVFAIPAFALSVGIKILKSAEETAAIKAESAQYRKQIEWQRAENEGYAAILEQANPVAFENYVLRTAREKLGLSLPGDKVYVDPAAASAATK